MLIIAASSTISNKPNSITPATQRFCLASRGGSIQRKASRPVKVTCVRQDWAREPGSPQCRSHANKVQLAQTPSKMKHSKNAPKTVSFLTLTRALFSPARQAPSSPFLPLPTRLSGLSVSRNHSSQCRPYLTAHSLPFPLLVHNLCFRTLFIKHLDHFASISST